MHVPCNMLNVSLLVVAVSREIGYKWASFYIWTILFRSEILSACLCAKSITSTPLCVSILLVETLSKECSNSNSNSISQQKKWEKTEWQWLFSKISLTFQMNVQIGACHIKICLLDTRRKSARRDWTNA